MIFTIDESAFSRARLGHIFTIALTHHALCPIKNYTGYLTSHSCRTFSVSFMSLRRKQNTSELVSKLSCHRVAINIADAVSPCTAKYSITE
jgi:hypothetical protein